MTRSHILLVNLVALAIVASGEATANAATANAAATNAATPAGPPQLGGIIKRGQQYRDLHITDEEEIALGSAVSEKVRDRYGVVQDKAVHRYVLLVGSLLVQKSERPGLPYTFIVLDTAGVNAFAAPGGFIHITRGALGLMKNEAELAGVLAHEITHVAGKHTIKAIQKGKMIQIGAEESLSNPALFSKLVDKTAELVLAGFGRNEELESDRDGLVIASNVGYAPSGLADFLTRLTDRNKTSTEKQGLFASHPEMEERLSKIGSQAKGFKPAGTAVLAERYKANISYKAAPITEVAPVEAGSAGLTGGSGKDTEKKDEGKEDEPKKKKKGFGLGSLMKPGGGEKKSAEVTGSGASRGVDTERNAKGGPVKTLVAVSITPSDISAFKKQGGLK